MASFERWVELWRDNPAQRNWQTKYAIGWVLEGEGGEVVGHMGNIPLAYHFRGRELRAVNGSGQTVRKDYRGYTMLLLDALIQQKGIDLLINGSVNPLAEPIIKALDFSKVPVGRWNESEFWILKHREFWRGILRAKSIPLASALSYVLAPLTGSQNSFRTRLGGSKSAVEECSEFDCRFDAFWEELKAENNDILLGVRTREALKWRFGHALSQQNAWVLTASKGRMLVAYAVFDRCDSIAFQLKGVRLVDFQALQGSQRLLYAFLGSAFDTFPKQGIDVLQVTGRWLDRVSLPKVSPPYHRQLPCWTLYYLAKNKELNEALKDKMVWAPSSFDGGSSV